MKIAIDAVTAKGLDKYSIDNGMSSLVLMERAALAVASHVKTLAEATQSAIIAVCGTGNNGADGIAAARILKEAGFDCHVQIVGSEDNATEEFLLQKRIAEHMGVRFINTPKYDEYNIIIDAVFGIGLSREVSGVYCDVIEGINTSRRKVVAVDISSGINASTGHISGCAVKADYTITFGYAKVGQLLFPGKEYSGKLIVENVGFLNDYSGLNKGASYLEEYKHLIPVRKQRTNKGDYGKPLIIAGSKDMSGAAFMSAMAAYRAGAGVVTVLTHENIDKQLKSMLPEAIVKSYSDENVCLRAADSVDKASIIVLGPGISVCETSRQLVKSVLDNAQVPVIIDADALNIIAGDISLLKQTKATLIITPHVGEMMRLSRKNKDEIVADITGTALEFAKEHNVICVLKDAVSAVAAPDGALFIATKGNPGMAKAGSGDVLTGILAAALSRDDYNNITGIFKKVCLGVHLHGAAGDVARDRLGENAMLARDIIDALPDVMNI